jgi:hypothetical protein
MKAFPILPSMATSTYGIFEYLTLDIIHLNRKSNRGYKYSALFVDKCSTKTFAYHLKRKSDLVTALKKLLRDYHPLRFPRCLEKGILHTDFDSLVLDKPFLSRKTPVCALVRPINISRTLLSAMSAALRTAFVLSWHTITLQFITSVIYAMDYFCYTFNNLPRINETRSRNESFFGVKPDLSRSTLPGTTMYGAGHFTRVWFS